MTITNICNSLCFAIHFFGRIAALRNILSQKETNQSRRQHRKQRKSLWSTQTQQKSNYENNGD